MAASNPNVVVVYPLLADLPPTGYPYQYAYITGTTAPRDGGQGMFQYTGGMWVRISTDADIPFKVSFPQDGDLMVFTIQNGGEWTNMLSGSRIIRVQATVVPTDGLGGNIDLMSPPTNIGGLDLEDNDRVFLYLQTNQVENGVYSYTTGLPLIRAANMPTGKVIIASSSVIETDGGDLAGVYFVLVTPQNAVIGTDATTWGLFQGAVFPRFPGTKLSGPAGSVHAQPEDWRQIDTTDLPPYFNGDAAFTKGGTSAPYILGLRDRVSYYLNINDPYAQATALTNALQHSNVVILDKPFLRFNSGISATVLSGKTLICDGNGKGGPVTIQITNNSTLFNLASVSNFRIEGTMHVQYRVPATTAKVISATGTTSNIKIDHLIVTDGWHCLFISGTVSNVHIGQLELNGFGGLGLYATGTDSSHQVTDVVVDWIDASGTGVSGNDAIYIDDFVGSGGAPGVTINGGVCFGVSHAILQTGSSGANAPRGCTFSNITSSSSVLEDFYINLGVGRTVLNNCRSYNSLLTGFRIGSGFTGSAFLDKCASELAQHYGIHILATAMEGVWIDDPRCVSNSQAASTTYSGIRLESGVGNVGIRGGISTGSSQGYGIDQQGTAPSNFLVLGTRVDGNGTSGINYTPGSTSLAKYCSGFDTSWT